VPFVSVEVIVFSWVAELVAVTVAPGIGVFPDFTTPVITWFAGAGVSCASEIVATSNRPAKYSAAVTKTFKLGDVSRLNVAQALIRIGVRELREALIYSTLRYPPYR